MAVKVQAVRQSVVPRGRNPRMPYEDFWYKNLLLPLAGPIGQFEELCR
ncbi:MAG TPA: hypothetical protein VGP76_09550 [Planctomycetaceae bacterium]|nr:hypothetical protein [Planctomycetaceae bacterium]HEV8067972.1 hypothetical protein [Planctomycetaceae bacterium]